MGNIEKGETIEEKKSFSKEEIEYITNTALACLFDPKKLEDIKTQIEVEGDPHEFAILTAIQNLERDIEMEQCS